MDNISEILGVVRQVRPEPERPALEFQRNTGHWRWRLVGWRTDGMFGVLDSGHFTTAGPEATAKQLCEQLPKDVRETPDYASIGAVSVQR